jgi:hypothetical protein
VSCRCCVWGCVCCVWGCMCCAGCVGWCRCRCCRCPRPPLHHHCLCCVHSLPSLHSLHSLHCGSQPRRLCLRRVCCLHLHLHLRRVCCLRCTRFSRCGIRRRRRCLPYLLCLLGLPCMDCTGGTCPKHHNAPLLCLPPPHPAHCLPCLPCLLRLHSLGCVCCVGCEGCLGCLLPVGVEERLKGGRGGDVEGLGVDCRGVKGGFSRGS